jgi:phosphatidylethanolamine N-methyltransferase
MNNSSPNSSVTRDAKPIIFELGSPIYVKWTAPKNRSRLDWIGIYKVTSNPSKMVTSVSSRGCYVYLTPEEEDSEPVFNYISDQVETGDVCFKGDQLPWEVGTYEFRYHHDNHHGVMTVSQPFEIAGLFFFIHFII